MSDTFRPLVAKLVTSPDTFTPDDLADAITHLLVPESLPPAQIGAFLAALHIRQLERRPEYLAAAVDVLRTHAHPADIESNTDFIVDIVGTGGDGHNTFNVSTTAAIVAAGTGARVIKHGAGASTSASGSADVLRALGCTFLPPPTHVARRPFTFLLAAHYHPALAGLAATRKRLPFRTLFNALGPLLNPARPRGLVVGVADAALGPVFAAYLARAGVRAMVVCGKEGLDEVSCAGETWVWDVRAGGEEVVEGVVSPATFGLDVHPLRAVVGGSADENAATLTALLKGTDGDDGAKEAALRPVREFVLMNASAVLVVAGLAADFKDGVQLARESIASGRAWAALEAFREAGRAATAVEAA